jgi:hypothetical protein
MSGEELAQIAQQPQMRRYLQEELARATEDKTSSCEKKAHS